MQNLTDKLPLLAPEEHAWLEQAVGRSLTNDEAQVLIHDATLDGAFSRWINARLNHGGLR